MVYIHLHITSINLSFRYLFSTHQYTQYLSQPSRMHNQTSVLTSPTQCTGMSINRISSIHHTHCHIALPKQSPTIPEQKNPALSHTSIHIHLVPFSFPLDLPLPSRKRKDRRNRPKGQGTLPHIFHTLFQHTYLPWELTIHMFNHPNPLATT